MLAVLSDAAPSTSGGKAATQAVLLREGLPIPDGFVVSHDRDRSTGSGVGPSLRDAVARELARLGDPMVAVRSSAADEDTASASAAGQYESIIGARGPDEVCEAIATCRASVRAPRLRHYRQRTSGDASPADPGMAVLVQRVIEADVSGVMFTPQQSGEPTRIEASWGLGLAVVAGSVTPDTYEVALDGAVGGTIGSKRSRADLDHEHGGVISRAVDERMRAVRTLDDATAAMLASLGGRIDAILGGPQDIEWAVAEGTIWILQARPVTAAPPAIHVFDTPDPTASLVGTPGSRGIVTATARVVRSPSDFPSVRPGDIVICPYTDPAWTPLFTIAAGVVTEAGGALSHAAIVAREYGIPAVLGVDDVTNRIRSGDQITLDGTVGTVSVR